MNKSLKDGEERGGCSYVSIATAKRHGKHPMFEDSAAVLFTNKSEKRV